MTTIQNYMEIAQEAAGENAHVAAVMNYRSAAELANTNNDLVGIMETLVDYAGLLKKPADRKAVYDWSREILSEKVPNNQLTERVKGLYDDRIME